MFLYADHEKFETSLRAIINKFLIKLLLITTQKLVLCYSLSCIEQTKINKLVLVHSSWKYVILGPKTGPNYQTPKAFAHIVFNL